MSGKRSSSMISDSHNGDGQEAKKSRTDPTLQHSGETHLETHGQHDLAFDNEFSRLMATIGREALIRMHQSKVLISGLKGLGMEIGRYSFHSLSPLEQLVNFRYLP
jgi:hypothetical protein